MSTVYFHKKKYLEKYVGLAKCCVMTVARYHRTGCGTSQMGKSVGKWWRVLDKNNNIGKHMG